MTSYAQNGEDVVLARAFREVRSGFYIDVGASDPVVDSVTKHFYERGWHGINIEPALATLAALRDTRPRDVNLGVALGESEGTATFYELPRQMTGCSTLSPELAKEYRRDGWEPREREVEVRTLAQVCEEHVGERVIDFLKIDVEGDELAVLIGADLARFRPRVLVVEATRPGTPIPAYDEWESHVLGARYQFVMFDGLNRFYVREEDQPLTKVLDVPASYFDDYVPHRYAVWKEDAENARSQAEDAHIREQQANARQLQANAREQQAVRAAMEQDRRAGSLELALTETRAHLRASRGALRDARLELSASRQALAGALEQAPRSE
jgi:FkbM family methyltransferase